MNAVDTNILLYAKDPRDAEKQEKSIELIETLSDGILIWQVVCEFLANSRKLEPFGYSRQEAWNEISRLEAIWKLALPGRPTLGRVQTLLADFSLSFWDALLVAACLEAGVTRLYSEDLTGQPTIDGLELVNPFAP